MAFPTSSGSSLFKLSKKSSQRFTPSAQEYLASLKAADDDALAREQARSHSPTPARESYAHTTGTNYAPSIASTPALSFASTAASTISTPTTHAAQLEEDDDPLLVPDTPPTSNDPPPTALHSEFGYCNNEQYRYTSSYRPGTSLLPQHQDPPMTILLATYISYLFLIAIGHMRDFFGKRFWPAYYKHLQPADGYAALNGDFDSFYTRRLKLRIVDCFSRPVTGVPGRTILMYNRVSPDFNVTFKLTGQLTRALNVSSYNYLGFAQATGGVADAADESIRRYGLSALGPRLEAGTQDLHQAAEALVARFLGMEDAMVVSMGFATNSTTLPAMVSRGSLVISDEYNHASIRTGVRLSGASVRLFKHNDMSSLEQILRESISQGQPRTHRPWKKILVVVEGLYSMEGTFIDLPGLMELKKRYHFYLYIDEAHSIGAIGPHGRGVCDYFGVDPREVNILMGTFTKSFGAAGGYIAGNKVLIDRLRTINHSFAYAESVSPPVLTQLTAAMASIMGVAPPLPPAAVGAPGTLIPASAPYVHPGPAPASILPQWMHLPPLLLSGQEGATRLRRLAFNSRYLSQGLRKLGFIIYGHRDSPIVPLLIFNPGKMPVFSRLMLAANTHPNAVPFVVVIVAYPATPLITSRVRFCMSASHTKADVDRLLRACDKVGDLLDLKHGIPKGERWTVEEVVDRAVELVKME
ncbi:PLP-dependent transferase [Dacryopinax primogenitus]|uniref:serine C-palmitoyltransferase n=1 Tax=Dacryopinax primogenitus (strain DJM 731) TaxID=1858805 RepID=M5G730_DACPD|nr:PLP-dependent transferase [Dacryopinax primogenitus]EJU01617.1 PLP-dependent transferase [Dacryopinax primogenitus]